MKGKLNIVGIGPGKDEHITPAALHAIKEAEYVIGYSTYIALVRHHLDGKQITRTGMTEEIRRAQHAVETARAGHTGALISSGDAGVYGMAGLVFEVLRNIGWKRGQSPEINLVPGVTAANSCASLVGAPLIHDTARISLSDLLTPWPVIEERIDGAARGDFVIVLYNPASGRRQRQIVDAARIIRQYRPGETPVALVKSAYRRQQETILSDLDHFLSFAIGMNTTVIVGSTNTFVYEGYMVTPRGYTNKYCLADGQIKEGQRKARSLKYETEPVDPGIQSALTALEILKRPAKKISVPTGHITGHIGLMGRMGGAIIFKSHERYFLVGELKVPCSFEEHGFEDVAERAERKQWAELKVKSKNKIQWDMAVSFQGEEGAREIYQRFAIYRNSSISERLLTLVEENSGSVQVEGVDYADARWTGNLPMSIWSIVRDEVLKC